MADPTRAQIVELLAAGPRPATEIHRAFAIAAPAVSGHLRVLKEAGRSSRSDPRRISVRMYALQPQPVRELAGWLEGVSRMGQNQLDSFKDFVALRAARPEAQH